MDKVATSLALTHLSNLRVLTINKVVRSREELLASSMSDLWHSLTNMLDAPTLCIKPARDGCSTGVARLCCKEDLEKYVQVLQEKIPHILSNTLFKGTWYDYDAGSSCRKGHFRDFH